MTSFVAVLALAGCGDSGQEPAPPTPTPADTAPASTTSATSPEPDQTPASPPTAGSTPPAPPSETTSPDPSTAGSLDETSLPQGWLGFTPEVVDPSEGEFSPNGTWVHGQDSILIAGDALPPCGTAQELPVPTAALTGTYRDPSNAPGNGIALEFESGQQARSWFEGYVEAVTSCQSEPAGFEVVDIAVEDATTLRDLRDYQGLMWAERVWVKDTVVQLMIVQGDFSLPQTTELPA